MENPFPAREGGGEGGGEDDDEAAAILRGGFAVIVHVDLDCFFVQVERRRNPSFAHLPVAVHQHDDIISVSYEARKLGVKKHDSPEDVRKNFPEVRLVHVEKLNGSSKVSYQVYHEAGAKVLAAIKEIVPNSPIEKASIDEAYIDVTDAVSDLRSSSSDDSSDDSIACIHHGTILAHQIPPATSSSPPIDLNSCSSLLDKRMWAACALVERIRTNIFTRTGFTTSAGIATGKVLAKFCSGLNKPNKQTMLLFSQQQSFLTRLAVCKLPKLSTFIPAEKIQHLGSVTLGDIYLRSKSELISAYGEKGGTFLYNMSRGNDSLKVSASGPTKSVACSMSLSPFSDNFAQLAKLVGFVARDLMERLVKDRATHKRVPGSLVFGWRLMNEKETSRHLSLAATPMPNASPNTPPLLNECVTTLAAVCMRHFTEAMVKRNASWSIRWIGITAGQFKQLVRNPIDSFLVKKPAAVQTSNASPAIEDPPLRLLPSAIDHADVGASHLHVDVECPFCGKRVAKPFVQRHMDDHFQS